MKDVFFSATQRALSSITSTYDTVWPIAVGLWNLRCMVNGVKNEFPSITEAQMAAKFSLGSGIYGVNYKRAFIEHSWEKQQSDFAWILLNGTVPIFEGWLEELRQTIFTDMKIKDMQFPMSVQTEVSRLTCDCSNVLRNSFYMVYLGKRERCYSQIIALMHCYRIFKEARNCYMHNGLKASQNLVRAYSDFLPYATTTALGVSEVPEFFVPTLGNEVEISLRGVVGFSYILIKIMVSLDTELLCARAAEKEFLDRYNAKHRILRTLKPDVVGARAQVRRYVQNCGFAKPDNVDDMISFLLSNHLISR